MPAAEKNDQSHASSSIELLRGSAGDVNTDYKITNNGDFSSRYSLYRFIINKQDPGVEVKGGKYMIPLGRRSLTVNK